MNPMQTFPVRSPLLSSAATDTGSFAKQNTTRHDTTRHDTTRHDTTRMLFCFICMLSLCLPSLKAQILAMDLSYSYQGGTQYLVTLRTYYTCGVTAPIFHTNALVAEPQDYNGNVGANLTYNGGWTYSVTSYNDACGNCLTSEVTRTLLLDVAQTTFPIVHLSITNPSLLRSSSINTIQNAASTMICATADIYIRDMNGNSILNNNPIFSEPNVRRMCNAYCFNDSLHFNSFDNNVNMMDIVSFTLTPALTDNAGASVVYNPNPPLNGTFTQGLLPPLVLSYLPTNTSMSSIPSNADIGVFGIDVVETRNGVVVGKMHKECAILTKPCALPTLTKEVVHPIANTGQTDEFVLTVQNIDLPIMGLTLFDALPQGLSATLANNPNAPYYHIGFLGCSQTEKDTVFVRVDALCGDTAINVAQIDSISCVKIALPLLTQVQDSDSIFVYKPEWAFTKTMTPPSPNLGDMVTFQVSFENLGDSAIEDTLYFLETPSFSCFQYVGLSATLNGSPYNQYSYLGGVITNWGDIPTNGLLNFSFTALYVNGKDTCENCAYLSWTFKDSCAYLDTACMQPIVPQYADVGIEKLLISTPPYADSSILQYQLVVTNSGPNGAPSGIMIADLFPNCLVDSTATFSSTSAYTLNNNLLTLNTPIPVNSSVTINLNVLYNPSITDTSCSNIATLISPPTFNDTILTNTSDTVAIQQQVTDISVLKYCSNCDIVPLPANMGNSFIIKIKNHGNQAATGIHIIDEWELDCFKLDNFGILYASNSAALSFATNPTNLELTISLLDVLDSVVIQCFMERTRLCEACENLAYLDHFDGIDSLATNDSSEAIVPPSVAPSPSGSYYISSAIPIEWDNTGVPLSLAGTSTNPVQVFIEDFTTVIIPNTIGVSLLYTEITLGEGARILIQKNGLLNLRLCTLHGCEKMWDKIEVQAGGRLESEGTEFFDAQYAVFIHDNANISLNSQVNPNRFINNYIGIFVPFNVNNQSGQNPNINNTKVLIGNGTEFTYNPNLPFLPPFNGQATHQNNETKPFAGMDIAGATLSLADLRMTGLVNGIIARSCNLKVTKGRYQAMGWNAALNPQDDYNQNPYNGSCIAALGGSCQPNSKCFGYLAVNGNGTNWMFMNSRFGVYTDRNDAFVESCRMVNMRTGIHVQNCENRAYRMFENRIEARLNGITAWFSDGASQFQIHRNHIEMAGFLLPGTERLGIGIGDMNLANPMLSIRQNEVELFTRGIGLDVVSVAGTQPTFNPNVANIMGNLINIHTPLAPNAFVGYRLLASHDLYVHCNEAVDSTDTQSGIGYLSFFSPRNRFQCNTAKNTDIGFYYSGDCTSQNGFVGNYMGRNNRGLYLATNWLSPMARMGTQLANNGNLWDNGLVANEEAFTDDNLANTFSRFEVDNASTLWGIHLPTNNLVGWFNPSTLPSASACITNSDVGPGSCKSNINGNIAPPAAMNIQLTDTLITQDSLYVDGEETAEWLVKRSLYNVLEEDENLLNSSSIYQQYYLDKSQETVGQFEQIQADAKDLIDANQDAVLLDYKVKIGNLLGNIAINDSVLQSGTAPQDSVFRYNQNIVLQDSIHLLDSLSRIIYMGLTSDRNDKATDIQANNEGIVTNEVFEENEKIVNESYTQYLKEGVSALDFNQLAAVAFQCPGLEGNAVFKARTLYRLTNDSIAFHDDSLCLYASINARKIHKKKVLPKLNKLLTKVTVHPNPANDKIIITFPAKLEEVHYLLLCNTLGQVVINYQLNAEGNRIEIPLSNLAEGIYHYQITNSSQIRVGNGKLIIQH
ncbi:MAG: T9SS type A sorting domain-containing protein [Bacteroidia bacterium]